MKTQAIFFLFLLGLSVSSLSQTTVWKWGTSRSVISNPQDSAFLVDTEKKIWAIEREKNAFRIYEGFFGGAGYSVAISKQAMEWYFADTSIAKVKFINMTELLSLWSTNADTCLIIGYEPMIGIERDHKKFQEADWKGITCYVHIPLYHYQNFLEKWEMKRLHDLTLNSFAHDFDATRQGDTLFRVIAFRDDSNGLLPQATFTHLGEMMKNGMLSGQLLTCRERSLATRMNKRSLEESFTFWDSSFVYEDPRYPGVIIPYPIQRSEQVVGVVLYEKWNPEFCTLETEVRYPYWRPQPYLKYVRQVLSYGLRLTSGKILWTYPQQFDALFKMRIFNWTPYEESFRAERFQTMHIALEP